LGSQNVQGTGVELWGGVECTINRIGDRFIDQWQRSGHPDRLSDFDRIASLGIRTLRQSVLWERVARHGFNERDWTYADAALSHLAELEIEPIVGLLHHGSGPKGTDLLDPDFPLKLAAFAREVAERYPHVRMYTPVNEPLTTARFSALYGLWYPHEKAPRSFATALLNQVKGTVLAMREIRQVNPQAQLVQTEDLGKTYATAELQGQADFENDRRWATWDLLCGVFDESSGLYRHFVHEGVPEEELAWFLENPCPPDVLGINTYVTSERFLDHRIERYPERTHGGNGHRRYADVEAVRVLAGGIDGPAGLIAETWARYGRTMAITECHLNCTREEQVRWLTSVWDAAQASRQQGVPVQAVTVWSLFGAYDWNSLLCQDIGCYEPGAFDLTAPEPRETALAEAVRRLAMGKSSAFPWLSGPGWWERSIRLEYPPVVLASDDSSAPPAPKPVRDRERVQPLLILGSGAAAKVFVEACRLRGLAYRNINWPDIDYACPRSIEAVLNESNPWAVVNAFGFERVEDAEREAAACFRDNTLAAMLLAQACSVRGIRLLALSTDQVFEGKQAEPYLESDMPWPVGNYGRSKWEAEYRIAEAGANALIVRTGPQFGPYGQGEYVERLLDAIEGGQPFSIPAHQAVTPTYLPDMAHAALDLLMDGETGFWHLAHPEAVTWAEFAESAVCALGSEMPRFGFVETGKRNFALASERGKSMPSLEDALTRWAASMNPKITVEGSLFLL
jgi:dTDP-4-dehydrorhamnose reductase